MTISQKLTDLYTLINMKTEDPYSIVEDPVFRNYLDTSTASDFCDTVIVYGFEVRDLEFGVYDKYVVTLKSIFEEFAENKFKEDLESNEELQTKYRLGMSNLLLSFCKRSGLAETSVDLEEGDVEIKDVEFSVNCLREAIVLLEKNMNTAKGILLYQTIKTLDYAWDVLNNYRVDNDNKPIDLDSAYVFQDQLPNGDLWEELIFQMRKKYNLT